MLSYQHAYHAGNPADVHKHLTLVLMLRRLQQKPGPICYVDTHAGRGVYDLAGAEARKTGESASGIGRLGGAGSRHGALADYLDLVGRFNPTGGTRYYPGSAALVRELLRDGDRAILLEQHPQEVAALRAAMGRDRRISVHARDAYEGLPALLPPPIRRGLVLIDPSYERKSEFDTIVPLLARAQARWPNAVYLLWYPLLPDRPEQRLLRAFAALGLPDTLIDEYRFADTAVGLQGSGLAIVNLPWQIERELTESRALVASILGPGVSA